MSQPDLPRFVQIIGRYRALVGLLAVLGLLGGAVFAALNPAAYTSKALVFFSAPTCPPGAICGGPAFPQRDVPASWLPLPLPAGVEVKPVTGYVLSISATAGTAARAEAAAGSAARGYLTYADSLSDMGEHALAQILTRATAATGTAPLRRLLGDALLGALFGALLGIIAALGGSGAIIDTMTAPPGFDVGNDKRRAGQEAAHGSPGIPLQQLGLEAARLRSAGDGPFDRPDAEAF